MTSGCQLSTSCSKVATSCCQVVTSCDQEVCLAIQKLQEKCYGVAGEAKKVYWRGGCHDSALISSDKIRAKILDLCYGGAHRALYNVSPKSSRILSAAIKIDGLTGALSNALAMPPAGVSVPVTMSTQG